MLLNTLKVTNSRGSVLALPFADISTGFIVKEIEGLDPVKTTLVSASFANADGEQYHSSRRESRNIILHLELRPDYALGSVKDLRDKLYEYFMGKSELTFEFEMFDKFQMDLSKRNLNVQIKGRVESFSSALFTKEPTVDISIMCFNPDFYALDLIEFDSVSTSGLTPDIITYDGSVDTGIIFTLLPNRSLSEFTIYQLTPDNLMVISDFSLSLVSGDILRVNTNAGAKEVRLIHAAVETSALYSMDPQSGWIQLQPGDNQIRVYATGAAIPYTIEYVKKYGGL